jgi:DNA modification methylase
MAAMDAGSVDAIVTDPPYGLASGATTTLEEATSGRGFMGKEWDRGVPGVTFWREALRVAKPGAYLLAFGGTRAFHRMAVAIEDAGWEIRDCCCWVYGSGFPKSLDASKAIDRMDAPRKQEERRQQFTAWVRSTGVTASQIDQATNTNMGGHYITAASQPAIMTRQHLEACRHLFGEIPAWVESEADLRSVQSENFAAREVTGSRRGLNMKEVRPVSYAAQGLDRTIQHEFNITAPATPEAAAWQGWGTALKPAWEPIIMARKPLEGTVAANLLKHGTGAINVDGCRIGAEMMHRTQSDGTIRSQNRAMAAPNTGRVHLEPIQGRWPANFMHDGSPEVLAGFPLTGAASDRPRHNTASMGYGGSEVPFETRGHADGGGSAARFFYCAKTSTADREEGCEELATSTGADATSRQEGTAGLDNPRAGASRTREVVRNHHPTVKPTELMRHLVRLVTPPGGLVLDPFMGSGSTGKAAILEGARFAGCDLDPAYLEIAAARIRFALRLEAEEAAAAYESTRQLSLFGDP